MTTSLGRGTDAVSAWVKARSPSWQRWLTQAREPTRPLDVVRASSYIDRYRALARDLGTARRLLPGSRTTAALEALYLQTHVVIDRSPHITAADVLRLFRDEIPAIMRILLPTVRWVATLLTVTAAAGWWLISTYPELIGLFASSRMIGEVEHGRLWTQDILNVLPSSIESVRILSNNITVSLMVFCSGIFLGLGVAWFVGLNGLMLGALFAFTHQHGLALELLRFALAHGPVELSVICVAGAAGMALGESLLRPTLPSRREAFQRTAHSVGKVLIACAVLLTGCGFIEGYLSPDQRVPMAVRALVGLGYWCLMLLFLSGRLFGRSRPQAT